MHVLAISFLGSAALILPVSCQYYPNYRTVDCNYYCEPGFRCTMYSDGTWYCWSLAGVVVGALLGCFVLISLFMLCICLCIDTCPLYKRVRRRNHNVEEGSSQNHFGHHVIYPQSGAQHDYYAQKPQQGPSQEGAFATNPTVQPMGN